MANNIVIDIRDPVPGSDRIIFADADSADDRIPQANSLVHHDQNTWFSITDGTGDSVIVNTENDARNLIRAIEVAISLGWVR